MIRLQRLQAQLILLRDQLDLVKDTTPECKGILIAVHVSFMDIIRDIREVDDEINRAVGIYERRIEKLEKQLKAK